MQSQYNQQFHNKLWRYYNISEIQKELAVKHACNKGTNVEIAGWPRSDHILDNDYQPKNPWKVQKFNKKKTIWPPHHTVRENECNLGLSCFLFSHQFILDMAERYSDEVQVAFKPPT